MAAKGTAYYKCDIAAAAFGVRLQVKYKNVLIPYAFL